MKSFNQKSNSRPLIHREKKLLKKLLSTLKYIDTTAQLQEIVHKLFLIINREHTEKRGEKPAKGKRKTTNKPTKGTRQVIEETRDWKCALIARKNTNKPTTGLSIVQEDTRERKISKIRMKHE